MSWTFVDPVPLLMGWAFAAALQLGLYLRMLRTRNAGLVDVGWALSLGLLGPGLALLYDGDPWRRLALGVLVGAWGLRLAWHLWTDRVKGQPEEGRYVHLREHWGHRANLHFLWFFQAQALLAVVLSLPFAYAASAASGVPTWTDLLALALCGTGVVGETIADRQLQRFKRDPDSRGRTCRRGLWAWSRHPNYFFEWCIWLGFGALGLAAPGGWIGLLAPALMLLSILKVTGIPPTEAQALRSRGEDYRRYQREVSAFVPLPPRGADSR